MRTRTLALLAILTVVLTSCTFTVDADQRDKKTSGGFNQRERAAPDRALHEIARDGVTTDVTQWCGTYASTIGGYVSSVEELLVDLEQLVRTHPPRSEAFADGLTQLYEQFTTSPTQTTYTQGRSELEEMVDTYGLGEPQGAPPLEENPDFDTSIAALASYRVLGYYTTELYTTVSEYLQSLTDSPRDDQTEVLSWGVTDDMYQVEISADEVTASCAALTGRN